MSSFYKHYCCKPHELSFVSDCVSRVCVPCVCPMCMSRVCVPCMSRVCPMCMSCVCTSRVSHVCPMCVSCVCVCRVCAVCVPYVCPVCVLCVCVCVCVSLQRRTWSGGGSSRTGAVLPSQGGGSQGTGGKVGAHTCPAPSPHSFIHSFNMNALKVS